MTYAATPDLVNPAHSTAGSGEIFRFTLQGFDEVQRDVDKTRSLSGGRNKVIQELRAEAAECASAGWDGYGAEPVQRQTLRNAENFIRALPYGIPMPAVGAEPDGHLDLEWYRSPGHLLSVSISPEGDLHYAALIGSSKAYGTEPFFSDIPVPILQLIERVSRG